MTYFIPNNSGTIKFTNGSTTIEGTGTLFTGYLAGGELVIAGVGSMQLAETPTGDLTALGVTEWQGATTGFVPFYYKPVVQAAVAMQKTIALAEQLSSGNMQAFAGLAGGADQLPYFNGAGTMGQMGFTSAARALLDDSDAATMLATLGAQPVGNYQPALGYAPINKAGDTGIGPLGLAGLLTTNGQVKFPSTDNPSGDANTLDDYEEGTITPTVLSSGGSIANYGTSVRYVKIGKRVFLMGYVFIENAGSGSGKLLIALPFVCQFATIGNAVLYGPDVIGSCFIDNGGTLLSMQKYDATSYVASGSLVFFSINFEAA